MPCCAFAAFLLSQVVLGLAAVKRLVFGGRVDSRSETNAAVEWRLAASASSATTSTARTPWRPRRLSMPVFVVAAVIELALVWGAIYGLHAHLGHVHGQAAAPIAAD